MLVSEAGGKEHGYLADFGLTKRTGSLSGISAPAASSAPSTTSPPSRSRATTWTPRRPLLPRLRPLRVPDRAVAFPPRDRRRPPLGARPRGRAPPRSLAPSSRRRSTASSPARSPRTPRAATRARTSSSPPPAPRSAWSRPRPRRATRRRLALAGRRRVAVLVVAARSASCSPATRAAGSRGSPRTRSASSTRTERLVADVRSDSSRRRSPPAKAASGSRTETRRSPRSIRPHALAATIPVGDYPSDIAAGNVGLGGVRRTHELDAHRPGAGRGRAPTSVGGGVPAARRTTSPSGDGAVWFACQASRRVGSTRGRGGAGESASRSSCSSSRTVSPSCPTSPSASARSGSRTRRETRHRVRPADISSQRDRSRSGAPIAIAVSARTLWVANFDDDTVSRIEIPGPGSDARRRGDPRRGRAGRHRGRRDRGLGREQPRPHAPASIRRAATWSRRSTSGTSRAGSPPGKAVSGSPSRRAEQTVVGRWLSIGGSRGKKAMRRSVIALMHRRGCGGTGLGHVRADPPGGGTVSLGPLLEPACLNPLVGGCGHYSFFG